MMNQNLPFCVTKGLKQTLVKWTFGMTDRGCFLFSNYSCILIFLRIQNWRRRPDIVIVAPKISDLDNNILGYACPALFSNPTLEFKKGVKIANPCVDNASLFC